MSKSNWRVKQGCYCQYALMDSHGNVFPENFPTTLPLVDPPVKRLVKTCMACIHRAFGPSVASNYQGARLFLEDLQKKGELTPQERAEQLAVTTALLEASRV